MSNKIETGGPAFPIQGGWGLDSTGLTLRDYLAAKAMQALIAKNGACHPADAYQVADAMLEARK